MRKKNNIIIIGLILIFTLPVFSQNITEPPYILSVKHIPQNPKENQIIKFTAKVKPFSKENGKLKVYLNYSSDNGKNYENIEMQNKNNIYTATLNGFKKNTEIIYSIKVLDENNLSSVQIPVINNLSDKDFSPDNLPVFSPSVIDEDTENNLPPELNIDEFALGYGESEDKKLLYGVVKMKGEIKEGTLSPTKINAGSILLQNPDIEDSKEISPYTLFPLLKSNVPKKRWIAIIWSHLLFLASGSTGSVNFCYPIDNRVDATKQPIVVKSYCIPQQEPGAIYWLIDYSSLDNNPSKNILFSSITSIFKTTDYSCVEKNINECADLIDHTPLTRFYLPSKNQIIKITE